MARAGVREVAFRIRRWWVRLSVGLGAALGGLFLLWGYPHAHAVLVRSSSLRAEDVEATLARIPLLPSSRRADLGVRYLYDPAIFDPPRALEHLRRAVRESPFDYRNWMHLGQGYEAVGDRARAEAAYRQAIACAPEYFLPRWLYANFLLKHGERERALEAFARAARLHPEAVANIAALLQNEERIVQLARLVPEADVRARLCAFLLSRGSLSEAVSLWRDLEWSEKAKFGLARLMIARGIGTERYALARALWCTLGQRLFERAACSDDLVWNGGFELAPLREMVPALSLSTLGMSEEFAVLDRDFDWRIEDEAGVLTRIAREESYEGERALRIEFTRPENVRFSGVTQLVLLRPAATYEVRFAYKAEVRGDPRVVVEIVGARRGVPEENGVLFRWSLPREADRTGWTLVREVFRAPPETSLVLLRIRRVPADALADFVKGRLWFDAFSIRPIGEGARPAERETS
jgi:tetratricopeptide (TPR) repeat protein